MSRPKRDIHHTSKFQKYKFTIHYDKWWDCWLSRWITLSIKFKTINMDSNNCIYDQDFTDRNLKSMYFSLLYFLSSHCINLFCSVMRAQNQIPNIPLNLYFKHSTTHWSVFEPWKCIFSTFYIKLHLIHENHLKYVNVKQFLWKKGS